jgi:hypothetical protein
MTLTPNRTDLSDYLDMMFGYLEPGEENLNYAIALRGLGEKGTTGEGGFNDVKIMPPLRGSGMEVDLIFGHVQRWSLHHRASFIVPAAVAASALSDGKATEDRIKQFTALVVDIDNGDTDAKLAHAVKYLGTPSMVVHSGGTTEASKPKLHVYWRLSEPSSDVERIALARKHLALKIGGDAAFGRSTQVIRLPGSIYSKGGVERPCYIAQKSTAEYELADLLAAIADMPVMEGLVVPPEKLGAAVQLFAPGGGLNFSAFKMARGDLADEKPDIETTLNRDIAEGGDIDRNRWGEFSRTAGYHIHQARTGIISLEKAAELTMTWAELHMKPVWPVERFNREWRAVLETDIKNHGPIAAANVVEFKPRDVVTPNNPNLTPEIPMIRNLAGDYVPQPLLADWDVSKLMEGDAPERKFLVEGLIMAGKPHLLASEGGAGKTFLMLDLGFKLAAHSSSRLQSWCGLPLADDAGGHVVIFTTEDDKEELHIRLAESFSPEMLERIKGRLTVFPTINTGGAFAMVERDRAQGPVRYGQRWGVYLDQLRKIKNLRLVVIDTLNTTLHGEENSATVINEYVQAVASPICGEMGAALVVTHHVRKPGANQKIYTAEDMKNSIRGSSALIGGFRVVLGIWHAPNYEARLTALGRDAVPGQLYNFAVVKANNPEMAYGLRTLLREKSGLLRDITDQEQSLAANTAGEKAAWLVHACAYAAEKERPFTIKALSRLPPNGRKTQLPTILHTLSERDMGTLAQLMIAGKRLVQCNPKGNKTYNHLDIPDGPLAMAMGADGGEYIIPPGRDFEPPDWEAEFAYHVVEGRIVRRGDEEERTVKVGSQAAKKEPVERPARGSFNPNNQFRTTPEERVHPIGCTTPQNGTAPAAPGLWFSATFERDNKVL